MSVLLPVDPILIVDDELPALKSFEVNLRAAGYSNMKRIQDSREVMPFLEGNAVMMILLDLTMPYVSGQELLKKVREQYPEIPVVVITGLNDVTIAVDCMKNGAVDYLLKPVERNRLTSAVKAVIELCELRRQYRRLKEHLLQEDLENAAAFEHIVTRSQKMIAIFKYLEAISCSSEPILISGDTGTGKELLAHAVHNLCRLRGRFVAVNTAGLDDAMFTDTLFGHRRGAFTDAVSTREGLIEQAQDGTLFLDEIGDLSPASQVKLLRLIQEKEYYPLGADVAKFTNARIVVATNRDLKAAMKAAEFRKDLFYRLSVHQVTIPPLRERPEDIPLLVDHFLAEAAEDQRKKTPTPPRQLYTLLETYHFPGNIRELRSMVYDAVSQHQGKVLSMDTFRKAVGLETGALHISETPGPAPDDLLAELPELPTIRDMEEMLIAEAVKRTKGNQSLAAQLLGITRQTLSSRLGKNKH
ncbi:MAG: sigma-54-dependent Fis family transcriptional regulator [Acidobacteria bacterium]|nr:sigma-54-dependent Fis family transcriptional regulator [Acidobacteriota bacterium]